MPLACVQCGRSIPAGAPFCASCGTPAPNPSAPHAQSPATTLAPAPRSAGGKGFLLALGSVGCLGVLVLGVVILGIVLFAVGRNSPDGGAGNAPADGPAYTHPLEQLVPQESGGYELQKIQPVDNETTVMLGAADALRARYSSAMTMLVLNYTSADRAANAVGPVRSALFPDAEGWTVTQQGAASVGHRVAALRSSTGTLATIWSHGSLVLIFWGDAAQVPAFEKAAPQILTAKG